MVERRGAAARWVAVVAAALVLGACGGDGSGGDGADPSGRPTTATPTSVTVAATTTTTSTTTTVGTPASTATPTTVATVPSTSSAPASSPYPAGPVDGIPPVPDVPAAALVDRLAVASGDPAAGDYRRKAFGDGWDYDPASGCNVRERVLVAESRTPPIMGERCKPLLGDWVSRYDGVATADPADLEIDHLVPLADAWRSGAARWTDRRREAFANDLQDPDTLVAVTTRSNRSKGDSSPDRWLPPEAADRCDYVGDWVRVKARWDLTVTPAEKAVLVQVLSGC